MWKSSLTRTDASRQGITGAPSWGGLDNERKIAYPFVRKELTKGSCVRSGRTEPAPRALRLQNVRGGGRPRFRSTAASPDASRPPRVHATAPGTGQPGAGQVGWPGIGAPG